MNFKGILWLLSVFILTRITAGEKGIRGLAGKDYPTYYIIPETSFRCSEQKYIPGYYADPETRCQVFHYCYGHRQESFLCPMGTIFNQPILTCDYWYSSDCSQATSHYSVNSMKKSTEGIHPETASGPEEQHTENVFDKIAMLYDTTTEGTTLTENEEPSDTSQTEPKGTTDSDVTPVIVPPFYGNELPPSPSIYKFTKNDFALSEDGTLILWDPLDSNGKDAPKIQENGQESLASQAQIYESKGDGHIELKDQSSANLIKKVSEIDSSQRKTTRRKPVYVVATPEIEEPLNVDSVSVSDEPAPPRKRVPINENLVQYAYPSDPISDLDDMHLEFFTDNLKVSQAQNSVQPSKDAENVNTPGDSLSSSEDSWLDNVEENVVRQFSSQVKLKRRPLGTIVSSNYNAESSENVDTTFPASDSYYVYSNTDGSSESSNQKETPAHEEIEEVDVHNVEYTEDVLTSTFSPEYSTGEDELSQEFELLDTEEVNDASETNAVESSTEEDYENILNSLELEDPDYQEVSDTDGSIYMNEENAFDTFADTDQEKQGAVFTYLSGVEGNDELSNDQEEEWFSLKDDEEQVLNPKNEFLTEGHQPLTYADEKSEFTENEQKTLTEKTLEETNNIDTPEPSSNQEFHYVLANTDDIHSQASTDNFAEDNLYRESFDSTVFPLEMNDNRDKVGPGHLPDKVNNEDSLLNELDDQMSDSDTEPSNNHFKKDVVPNVEYSEISSMEMKNKPIDKKHPTKKNFPPNDDEPISQSQMDAIFGLVGSPWQSSLPPSNQQFRGFQMPIAQALMGIDKSGRSRSSNLFPSPFDSEFRMLTSSFRSLSNSPSGQPWNAPKHNVPSSLNNNMFLPRSGMLFKKPLFSKIISFGKKILKAKKANLMLLMG